MRNISFGRFFRSINSPSTSYGDQYDPGLAGLPATELRSAARFYTLQARVRTEEAMLECAEHMERLFEHRVGNVFVATIVASSLALEGRDAVAFDCRARDLIK